MREEGGDEAGHEVEMQARRKDQGPQSRRCHLSRRARPRAAGRRAARGKRCSAVWAAGTATAGSVQVAGALTLMVLSSSVCGADQVRVRGK